MPKIELQGYKCQFYIYNQIMYFFLYRSYGMVFAVPEDFYGTKMISFSPFSFSLKNLCSVILTS